MTTRFHSFSLICSLFLLLILANPSFAEVSGPGWIRVAPKQVSIEEANAYYSSISPPIEKKSAITKNMSAVLSQAILSNEITELARGLRNDPKLIFDYVHNHIDYVPYFGSLKGATVTLLERSGNDFDQASLMIALLRASGFSAQYVYGYMVFPNVAVDKYDVSNWLGVSNYQAITSILSGGGIPNTVSASTTQMMRVWVKALINGVEYVFDPAFKIYQETQKINLVTAMGYSQSELMTAAGGTAGVNFIRNISKANVQTKLDLYSNNLIAFLRSNYPNANVDEIVGGRTIIQESTTQYQKDLRFQAISIDYWDEIPDVYKHTVQIQFGGIDITRNIEDIAGKRLAIPGQTFALSKTTAPIVTLVPVNPVKSGNSWNFSSIFAGSCCVNGTLPFINNNYQYSQNIGIEVTNTSGSAFTATLSTSYLMPYDSAYIYAAFSGVNQSPGSKTATLKVKYCDVTSYACNWPSSYYSASYNLSGNVVEAPNLNGSYGIDTGQNFLGNPYIATARLKNSGTAINLVINSITLTGTNPGSFQVISGNSSGTLLPGQIRDIGFTYLANAVGKHNANIRISASYGGVQFTVDMPISGETLPIPKAQLWLDDEMLSVETTGATVLGADLTLTIKHPYAIAGTDQAVSYKKLKRGSSYVIISDFSGSKAGMLLKKRQRILDDLREKGLANDSREVLTETLNVMGQTWMRETTLVSNLLSSLSNVVRIAHHRFGVMAQETGYYVDVKAQMYSLTSKNNNSANENAFIRADSLINSALEHGVLEQLQGGAVRPAASTVKLLEIANTNGNKIYVMNHTNYATVASLLTGYSSDDIAAFKASAQNGATLVLPENGTIAVNAWKGKGYIEYKTNWSDPLGLDTGLKKVSRGLA